MTAALEQEINEQKNDAGEIDFYGAIEENNDEQDLMDIAITSHKELILPSKPTPEDIIQTDKPSNIIVKAAEKPSNRFQIPTLPSEFVGQKFGVYVANLNWVCCYFYF